MRLMLATAVALFAGYLVGVSDNGGARPPRLTVDYFDDLLLLEQGSDGFVTRFLVDKRYDIRQIDKDGDGVVDTWDLYLDGNKKCRRWIGRKDGGPNNGAVLYLPDGSQKQITWGSHRDNESRREADRIKDELKRRGSN